MQLTPALRDLYEDTHPFIVVQKGAQVGITEWMISGALWVADTGQGERGNSLYVMPTESLTRDLAAARVNRAIDESAYLTRRVREESQSRRVTDRLDLKALGEGYVHFKGSESHRQITSIGADAVFLDEFDLMDAGVLPLALQRIGSSRLGWIRIASTPRYPELGINRLYLEGDRRKYHLPCPRCGKLQKLDWPASIDFERMMLVCQHPSCRTPMDVWAEGRWIPEAPSNTRIRSYQLSRLYSPMANIERIVLEADATSLYEEQQFQNQVLGEIFVPKGGGLTLSDLDACRTDYQMSEYSGQACFMGVDIGGKIHNVVIRERTPHPKESSGRLWYAGEVSEPHELAQKMKEFNVVSCVIDGEPQGFLATQVYRECPGRVSLAYYTRHQPGHETSPARDNLPPALHINRTDALDELTFRFKSGAMPLPHNSRTIGRQDRSGMGDYYRHLLSIMRTMEEDSNGNWKAKWIHSGPDHYAHAENYCMLAGTQYQDHRIYAA
jgi:hypothetical protein